MPFLSIDNLNISFGETNVFVNFNLALEEGCIYSIVGPSGCGKSTLLKAVCGIIQPQQGTIRINNEDLDPHKQMMGYIPQQYGLLSWLKVKENLSLPEKIRRIDAPNKERIIDRLDIGALLERYPSELSGGQKQRVALARAWIMQPDLLLMDEPFSSLDMFTAERSRKLFVDLWKEQRTTTLFVTHNLPEAVRMGKFIMLLSKELPCQLLQIIENPLFNAGASRAETDFIRFEQQLRLQLTELWEEEHA